MKKRRRVPEKPPIEERHHWREEHTILARKVRAGDALILKQGRTRRFFHICEVEIDKHGVEVVYNDSKEIGGVGRIGFARNKAINIRRTYHD